VAFCGKACLRGAVFIFLECAAADHAEQRLTGQSWLLCPEQAASPVSVAQNFGFQGRARMGVAELSLVLEESP
jgi:hypothetical protein